MPELPEVEIVRRGIEKRITNKKITDVIVRERRLRYPVWSELESTLRGRQVLAVERRGKYLLLQMNGGCLLVHLGMSGRLRVVPPASPYDKHDHVDIIFDNNQCLRFRNPRRLGCVEWTASDPNDPKSHHRLRDIGPEPLSENFNGEYLFQESRGRRRKVKAFIRDQKVVAGVGNIYANESLFRAGIHPGREAVSIDTPRYETLATEIKSLLSEAINAGGTSLGDVNEFINPDDGQGSFGRKLQVYGREGQPCPRCRSLICRVPGQPPGFYCAKCQPEA